MGLILSRLCCWHVFGSGGVIACQTSQLTGVGCVVMILQVSSVGTLEK